MAIKQVNKAIAEIYGLSTDTKPTFNVPLGSKFTEEDTGKKWELGQSGWFPSVVQSSIVGSLPKKTYTAITAFNALAITDTNVHDALIDVSNIQGQKFIILNNSHNQGMTLTLHARSLSGLSYDYVVMGSKTPVAGGVAIYTDIDFPALHAPIESLRIRAQFAVAPTSGSLIVVVGGISS